MTPAPLADVASAAAAFGPVVQFAWHAPDLEAAAEAFASKGAGPFYLLPHIKLARALHRGRPAQFDHSSAYGQQGDLMIELIHQHGDDPSAVRDMYSVTETGWHHAAIFVPNIEAALARAAQRGFDVALDATTADNVRFVMVDARASCGLMLELYEPCEALQRFYAFIKRKSEGWAGEAPLRPLR